MKSAVIKTVKLSAMSLILLLLTFAYATNVHAAKVKAVYKPVVSSPKSTPTVLMARGQAYVPPQKHHDHC